MKRLLILMMFMYLFNTLNAQKTSIFISNGKAIRGYDPIAFFTESKPIKGKDSLNFEWNSATWNFSSEKNLNLFKSNPELYAPQFGGYCAYGTSENHKAPTQTETWTILNNKLYFNYNQTVKQKWISNQDILIKQADYHWKTLKDKE